MTPLPPRLLAGALAWLVGLPACALSLGEVQGAALIGRPLEVGVRLEPDPGQALPVCADAQVFYGAHRVDPDQVAVRSPQATGAGTLWIRSARGINDPVVTLHLRVGCEGQVARRYVLLAERPPLDLPAALASLAVAEAPAAVAAAPVAPAATAATAATAASAETPRAAPPAKRTPAPVTATLRLEPVSTAAVEAPPFAESGPALRLAGGLTLPAAEASADQRALLLAAWQALNAAPEDLRREAQRHQALQAEVQSLRHVVRQQEPALAALREQLQKLQRERYANPLVFLLCGLVVLATVSAVIGWRLARRKGELPETDFGPTTLPPISRRRGVRTQPLTVSAENDPSLGDPAGLVPAVMVKELHGSPGLSFFQSLPAEAPPLRTGLDFNLDDPSPAKPKGGS
ncbi:MAG TPA: hypothetical protein VEA35_18505 [Ramlibacter sp.]|nr:hypothetical protein [Ramlibacter sp.]